MTKLSELATNYVAPTMTENIADAGLFSIDVEVTEETHTKKDGETFTVNVASINGKKYRVPSSVLEGIKAIMSVRKDVKMISIIKTGSGMNTKYQVIPN
jgi:hypothetical protein